MPVVLLDGEKCPRRASGRRFRTVTKRSPPGSGPLKHMEQLCTMAVSSQETDEQHRRFFALPDSGGIVGASDVVQSADLVCGFSWTNVFLRLSNVL
jgi:hypothetical protein